MTICRLGFYLQKIIAETELLTQKNSLDEFDRGEIGDRPPVVHGGTDNSHENRVVISIVLPLELN
jgi:hypothetical protein